MNRPDFENCKTREWFAVAQLFGGPFTFENPESGDPTSREFGVGLGVQIMAAMDVASQYALLGMPVPRLPGSLTANEVCDFLDKVFSKHGKPTIGIVLADSLWKSSHELLLDEQTRSRGEWLSKMEIEIPPMPDSEKSAIEQHLVALGLRVQFGED